MNRMINKKKKSRTLRTLYAVSFLLIFWQIASGEVSGIRVIPSPGDTFSLFLHNFPHILSHLISSLTRLAISVSVSLFLGASFGYMLGMSEHANRLITPILHLLYPIPRIAFLPVFLSLFGLGELSKMALIVAVSCFYVIFPIRNHVHNISEHLLFQARLQRFGIWKTWKHLVFPSSLPSLFTSAKLVIGVGFASLFFTELYGTQKGIAYYIMNAWFISDYPGMYAGIVALSASGIFLFELLDWSERFFMPWKYER